MQLKSWSQLDKSHKLVLLSFVLLFVILTTIISNFVISPIATDWEAHQVKPVNASHTTIEAVLHIQHPTIKKINQNAPKPVKNSFIDTIGKSAVYDYRHNKHVQVAPSVTVAQAIIESNWGQSQLYTEGKNAFGMKAVPNSPSITFGTSEFYNGSYQHITAQFRKYSNINQSINDHNAMVLSKFIHKNHDLNYVQVANLLECHKLKYATDPNYTRTIIQVIDTYDLNRFDKMVKK